MKIDRCVLFPELRVICAVAFWIIFSVLSLCPVHAQTAVDVSPVIAGIEVRGNKTVPTKEILDNVFSRVGESLVEEKIKGDLKAIYALGCFSDVTSSYEAVKGGTKIVFLVKENPTVKDIIIQGNSAFSSAEIISNLKTKKGARLNFKTLQEDIDSINLLYKKNGYMLAHIIDVNTGKDDNILRFKISEGRVESIVLEGNEQTKDYVILRELKTRPGKALNEDTLKKDLRRVFNLGFFSEINPDFQPGSSPDKVILTLKIKEARSSTVNFGGGFGEREGWFGFVDLSMNNLLGTAQGLMLRGQSGQQFSTYQFKYFNPWLFPEKLGERTAFTFRRWLTVGRDVYLTTQDGIYNGFDFSFGKPLNDFFNTSLTLGSENVSPYGTNSFEAYLANTVELTLSYDTRDFWLNPREGTFISVSGKQGWKYASAKTNFFKFSADGNRYIPTFPSQLFALHAGVGIGLGDIPVGDLFWAGGVNSVRGYYPSQAKTGKRKLIFNLEYRINFSDVFQGVFFYDAGDAWDTGNQRFSDFLCGWGPGIRVNTPLGPIRLDWGVPAGKTFGEGIMHFSIGQAF